MADKQELPMKASISRRDFVNGAAVALGAIGVGGVPNSPAAAMAAPPQSDYPPAKTGLRGSHPGSFEAAHALRDGSLSLDRAQETGESFDLVIVGGGFSGLAAAHYYLKSVGSGARILIIENHDDFGGHAKRNEFMVDGKLLVINGGVLEIESPERYNQWARQLLDDIGVDIGRFEASNKVHHDRFAAHNLSNGFFFDRETWREDRLVVSRSGGHRRGLPRDVVAASPLPARAKADLYQLLNSDQPDYLAGKSLLEKKALLATTSYRDYLLRIAKIDEQALWFFQHAGSGTFCVGADAYPAIFAWVQGYPGFDGLGLGSIPDGLFDALPGGQHGRQKDSGNSVHFPDGSATLARLLVAKLIPSATNARSQEEMGSARIDYTQLDRPSQPVRIRLSSTVLNVRHDGDPRSATEASVTYAQAGDAGASHLSCVRAKNVIMACWNMFIPHLVPSLPEAQREALAYGVKGPLAYTNVALRNWRAFEKLGLSGASTPTMFHQTMALAEPVGLGALTPSTSPDEPVVVCFTKYFGVPGMAKRDQHRAGRAELLGLAFADFERQTREQLSRILGPGGFDADQDIAGITVNRWPHGYAYTYNSLYDPLEWVFSESSDRPCVRGRQPFGLVSIANSDAAASPHTDAAFLEARRAVGEVIARTAFPFVRPV